MPIGDTLGIHCVAARPVARGPETRALYSSSQCFARMQSNATDNDMTRLVNHRPLTHCDVRSDVKAAGDRSVASTSLRSKVPEPFRDEYGVRQILRAVWLEPFVALNDKGSQHRREQARILTLQSVAFPDDLS